MLFPTFRFSKKTKIFERLKIELGKWVDFDAKTTRLVDDVLIRDPKDTKSIGVKQREKKYWAGRWKAHTPLKVIFNTTLSENEVLKINGKRIEVLDRTFEEFLQDNRSNTGDDERVFDYGVIVNDDTQKNKKIHI
ncbi:hypothetical protein KQ878_01665 [Mycoplasma zalophidermidis]|uniref:Uncharacterized protein n=1 Tax=Mycoplasma zalophidermidis TaxID=398174 RepID=A0ABS6DSY0_9MOLU|nr:hypothetical protein [Mycoplasma zalophidermidis]MBU4689689.1 hypothetical protein [Mycoplasma zalophidermidis]MBU4693588.1 hypothetical protein [Mycoplasma zalophidermidis]MCR8966453.1 hypothetical protein [Mycoplasma zalophidermidis]